MLNITHSGEEHFKSANILLYLKPEIVFDIYPDMDEVKKQVALHF